MKIPRRSLLTGTVAAAALASMRESAEAANVPFTTFPFKATGGTATRTQPDRIADIKNVLDFGADPSGNSGTATATTAAIQAAVNSLGSSGRGTIFFPVGTYITNSAVTYNYNGGLSIQFLGADGGGSIIQAASGTGFAGFLFDRHNVNSGSPLYAIGNIIFEKLKFVNNSTSGGCIRMGSTIGGAARDCTFTGFVGFTTEDSAGNSSQSILIENCKFSSPDGTTTPQENIIIGGSGAILGCDASGVDTAIRAYGTGLFMAGNRAEQCNTHYLLGADGGNNPQPMSGFTILGGSSEGCTTALDMGGTAGGVCSGFLVAAGNLGHDKSNSGYPIGTTNSQYGVRVRSGSANNGVFLACGSFQFIDVAGISIGNASSRANLVFIDCAPQVGAGSGVPWIPPTNAYTALFQNCSADPGGAFNPIWTFSQLPSGGNVVEGDEFSISDSTTNTWGATIAGSSTNRVLARYNGTNWTVVAK